MKMKLNKLKNKKIHLKLMLANKEMKTSMKSMFIKKKHMNNQLKHRLKVIIYLFMNKHIQVKFKHKFMRKIMLEKQKSKLWYQKILFIKKQMNILMKSLPKQKHILKQLNNKLLISKILLKFLKKIILFIKKLSNLRAINKKLKNYIKNKVFLHKNKKKK